MTEKIFRIPEPDRPITPENLGLHLQYFGPELRFKRKENAIPEEKMMELLKITLNELKTIEFGTNPKNITQKNLKNWLNYLNHFDYLFFADDEEKFRYVKDLTIKLDESLSNLLK